MNSLEQIHQMEQRLLRAMLTSDVNELDVLISDQAIVSGIDGRLSTKTEDLAAHRDGSLRIQTMVPQEMTVQFVSDVAIVFALITLEGSFQDQAFAGRLRYTRVWHKPDNEWQIVAAHISSVPGY